MGGQSAHNQVSRERSNVAVDGYQTSISVSLVLKSAAKAAKRAFVRTISGVQAGRNEKGRLGEGSYWGNDGRSASGNGSDRRPYGIDRERPLGTLTLL